MENSLITRCGLFLFFLRRGRAGHVDDLVLVEAVVVGPGCGRGLLAARRKLTVTGERPSTRCGYGALVGRLHRNYEVRTVGHHHVCNLLKQTVLVI